MATEARANERPILVEGEIRIPGMSFDAMMAEDDTITGTPTVVEVSSSDLNITGVAKNAAEMEVSGETVPANRGLTFTLSGQKAATRNYLLKATVQTTLGETLILYGAFTCVVESAP